MSRRDTWLYWGLGVTGFLALLAYPHRPKSTPKPSAGPLPGQGVKDTDVLTYQIDPSGKILVHTAPDVAWETPKLASASLPKLRAMVETWRDLVEEASLDYRVPLSWLYAIMWSESQGDPRAQSPAGALGLMQVLPMHFKPGENPLDPRTNVRRGASILQTARAKGPDLVQSASIYNAGMPPDGKGPWTNAVWLAAGRKPAQTTRWGYAAEPGYLDSVVAANNTFLTDIGPSA